MSLDKKTKICANPNCRSTNTKKNGFHKSCSFIIRNLDMEIKIGQHKCNDCGCSWSVDADELKKQELYDVFYPRKELISFVKAGLKKLDKIKDEELKEEKDIELQKKLMKLKNERKKKRRRKNYVHEHKEHTLKKANKKFEFVKMLRHTYPKKVQRWINKIETDWEHYALFLVDLNVPPTSNGIEQHFSSTLQRSEKKKFRNIDSLNGFLKAERIKKSGVFLSLISVLGLNFIEIIGMFLETFLGI